MNLTSLVKQKVQAAFENAGFENATLLVRLSDRPDISDYQSNGALPLAKELKQNPRALAEKIAAFLKEDSFFEKVSVDGPGFINMTISNTALSEVAYSILSTEKSGYENPAEAKTVVFDYGGPNIAKALHVGHLRPAIIGEAIKRLHKFVGNKVIGDVHLGDWGLPMGLLMAELSEREPESVYFDPSYEGEYPANAPFTGHDLEVMYPIASQKSKQDPAYLAKAKDFTRRLQNKEKGLLALLNKFVELSVGSIRQMYDELGVSFELWRGERDVHDRLLVMLERLKKEGVLFSDAGAEIIEVGKSKSGNDLPPLIAVNSDGAVMYAATDLATIEERVEEFGAEEILYVVDARQALHFEQVFNAAEKIGLFKNTTAKHLGFGTINGKDNKPFKTRDGGVMTLRMLIDLSVNAALKKMNSGEMGRDLTEEEKTEISKIVGVSALKFADLMNERMKNYIFDEDKLTSTEGKTGPYLLYAMVRMKSLLEKSGETVVLTPTDVPVISHPAERQLLLRLYAMPDSIQTAYDNNAPHVVCDYLFKLAQDFNLFYHDCPIKDAEPAVQKSRLALTKYALTVALKMADVLGLQVPDKM